MFRMPFLISALVMITGLAWTLHLVVSPDPWAVDSALAIAIGTLIYSIVAMAALLLGRGRWTRYFAIGLVTVEMLIATVGDLEGWLIGGLILGGLTLAGLGGPWFKGWLRERPAAGAPGIQPILLALGGFAMVPLVGLAAPGGLKAAHGVAGAVGILLSWTYLKGGTGALWAFRSLMPLVVVAAALSSPWGGSVLLLAAGAGLSYLAWLPVSRLAVDPLPAYLPAPRKRST